MDSRISELKDLLPQAMLPDWVRLGARLVRLLRDSHHQRVHDAVLDRLLAQAKASVALRQERKASVPNVHYPENLPIAARKDDIIEAIRRHQVIIVAGETGSGKTTQIPKMCLEAGLGVEAKIGCTQPRRIAALSISRRIAEELNVEWGREVGCKIRFDDRSDLHTYVKVMTDGILLAELQGDRLLSEYNAIIIDEAHERSLNIDFLLGYLKGLLAKRPELKLIITSATIDTEAFSKAFNGAPVLEVSGRVYPVEVVYAPLDAASEESGDLTYIDATARTVEQIAAQAGGGDVLVFMPGERDIRETRDLLQTRLGDSIETIPLFGRLTADEQQRAFAPASRRKVIIATNIAETSLTVPGIRYVIDSGLARISRYNPRTRTRRLPIEPIAQSSANQRKGRSGRVQNGVCIRLYSEDDFAARPAFIQPEIQRANLAEVILRMKAFELGEIESFPFINPPSSSAIEGGYRLLQELGALDPERQLLPLGRDLARLPIDPTLGRMLLQAQHEHAARELLIIAAGLSIQDPRERPFDQKDAAAAAHKRFADPHSDFLTLLNLWQAVHEQWETLRTQNQRRKFCKTHFLSYLRMREWQDLHAQLEEALEDLGTVGLNESTADYDAIHRSILTGLLGHVGTRTERNIYRGQGNRQLNVFPGSVLFERATATVRSRKMSSKGTRPADTEKTNQPEWIIAGEIVETSQLFARTVAGINPEWILELAPHLCKTTHHNPHWSAEARCVLAEERIFFFGLEIRQRKVAYGNVDPKNATEIFIRQALVEEQLFPQQEELTEAAPDRLPAHEVAASGRTERQRVSAAYGFIEHNRRIRHKIETWQTRMRRADLTDLDQSLLEFYAARIQNVSSMDELNRWLREHSETSLRATETDLVGDLDLSYDAEAFPDRVQLAGKSVPLAYSYSPGEEWDGVTVRLEQHLIETVSAAAVEWAVPGLRRPLIAELLRALPKATRRELMPLAPKVEEIARELQPGTASLKQDVARFIQKRYGVQVSASAWESQLVPAHLQPRVEVLGQDQKPVRAGRDLGQLRQALQHVKLEPDSGSGAWNQFAAKLERFGLSAWSFGDLPESIAEGAGADRLEGWPGLELEEGQINLRLFRNRDPAQRASLPAVHRLAEVSLQKDLAWLQKDLRALTRFEPLLAGWCTVEELQSGAYRNLLTHLLPAEAFPSLQQKYFRELLDRIRQALPGLASKMIDQLQAILNARIEIVRRCPPALVANRTRTVSSLKELCGTPAVTPQPTEWLIRELNSLMPSRFLESIPFERLPHLPRYLKALRVRAERAVLNPAKDRERCSQVVPYVEWLGNLRAQPRGSDVFRLRVEEFRWMLEEFKVSVFAQELGTSIPVSPKRLNEQLARIREVQ